MRPAPENRAMFRFYEELNDFLPSGQRKKENLYRFNGNPSIKDAIEAQNVPHTEVDLILVNGNPVDFGYKLLGGDRVSVYPVFESFDIGRLKGTKVKPLRETKFILDVHLGKLAKLLRMTGFDTLYHNNLEDKEIIELALAQNRIILTRDRGILKNSFVRKGYYIRSQKPEEQLKEVMSRFQLQSSTKFLSRCITCNGEIGKVKKKDIEQKLKPGTSKYFDRFFQCTGCGRIYWEGSHYDRMLDYYKNLKLNLKA
jgi:uncharacterized protein